MSLGESVTWMSRDWGFVAFTGLQSLDEARALGGCDKWD